jgi:small nuclear ribonucleoprotein (snRNP)-like protein
MSGGELLGSLIYISVFVVGFFVLFTVVRSSSRPRGVHALVGERVVLQTKDDRSIRGVLTGCYRDCVAVSHVEYLDEAKPAELPGEALVRFDNLSWIHKLGPGD